ncbi:ANTAR domain protein [compost metagenome]
MASLKSLLEKQSTRLAQTEMELDAARRALQERKLIERAKSALMARMGLSEDEAFRALQKASMDNHRRLVDIAEATLSLCRPRPAGLAPSARRMNCHGCPH